MRRLFIVGVLLFVGVVPAFAQNNDADVDAQAVDASMANFNANARAYGLTNPQAELKARSSMKDERGQRHVRMDQYHQGVRVFEGEAISHVDSQGRVESVTNAIRGNLRVSTTPSLSEATAITKALAAVKPLGGVSAAASLEILPQGERSSTNRLVWHVVIEVDNNAQDPGKWDTFIDARTGEVVWSFDSLETTSATGTGRTQYLGDKTINLDLVSGRYYMRDLARASNYTCDLNNGTSTCTTFSGTTTTFGDNVVDGTNRATSAADAHHGLQASWDYFKNVHGRNGINGSGSRTYSRVHYSSNYNNAFWSGSCFCMTYGDGSGTPGGTSGFLPLVSIDVAGHELAHGVTASSANLTYSGESGGLNESTSDIFGTMVEFSVNSTADVPDYLIGERIKPANWNTNGTWKNLASPAALRYMNNPSTDGVSQNCWYSGIGSLNVHHSSGPNNHMFYLLAQGGTSACNGNVVTGIGRSAAEKIWYRALTAYMTSSTNYNGARTAALNAAASLYGTGSTQYNAVAAAFSAINVN
jgi:Zn-dependent metalloprotease